MKKNFYIITAAALSLVACSRNQEVDVPDANLSLFARTESPAETKTVVESGTHVFWEPGDEIAVFMGEKSAKFTTDLTAASGTATFKGTFGDTTWPEEPDIWAVYPFSEDAVFDVETITTTLPSEQVAREGSFGKDMNLAIAHSSGTTLQFYNVGGGLRFSVTEEGIKKVMFEGLSGEIISGKVKIGFEDGLPVVKEVTGGSQFITLLPPSGQEAFEPGAWYYIVAIPGALDGGFKLRFYKDSDYARKVSEKAVTIKRSIFGNVEKADEGIEYEAQTLHFPDTEAEWDKSVEITKSIASIASVMIDSLRNDSHSSATDYIETLLNIDGVLDVWVDSENDLVAILQKDSLVVNYPNPQRFFHSPESIELGDYATVSSVSRTASNRNRKSSPRFSSSQESFKDKKAIILIPCEMPGTDYYTYHNNYLRDCLLDMGYTSENIVSKLGPEADIEFYSGEELSKYDYIHFTTHGDVGYYTYQEDNDKRKQGTCFASATEYDGSWAVYNLASKKIKKEDIALMYCDHVFDNVKESKFYVCMTSDFLKNASFDNSCVLITACHSAATVNGVVGGTILSEFYDKGAGVASGYLHTGRGEYTEPFTRFVTRLLCHGISYQDAVNYLQNSSWFDAYILNGCIEKQRNKLQNQEITIDEYQSYLAEVSHDSYFYFPLPGAATQPYHLNELGLELNDKVGVSNGAAILNWDFNFTPFVEKFSYNDYSIFESHTDVISYDVQYDVHIDNNIVLSPKQSSEKSVSWESPAPGDHTWYVIAKIVEGNNVISTYQSDKKRFTIDEQKPDPPLVETFPASVDVGYVFLSGDVTNRSLEGLETGFYYYKMTADEETMQLSSEDSLRLVLSGNTILSTGDYKDYFGVNLTDIEKNSKYLFMAYAKDEYDQIGEGGVLSFEIGDSSHQDYAIPDAVDLGLPSGLKWASFNLGASKPEEYGDYYAWGETEPYYSNLDPLTWKPGKEAGYDWLSYKWCMGSYNTLTKYCSVSHFGYNGFMDTKTVLDSEDDAACMALSGKWRVPTDAEFSELRDCCSWKWTSMNGINGRKVTGPNGNSIFLPAAGYREGSSRNNANSSGFYWSSSLYTGSPWFSWYVGFASDDVRRNYGSHRYFGLSIRPVYEDSGTIPVESVVLDKTEQVLAVGETTVLVATVFPANATNTNVLWSSSDESIVTVSSTGAVTGVGAGSAVITVTTSDGGKTATCSVTVKETPSTSVPEMVDLGLSVKWASFNLGASKPEEVGDRFAWGETDTKSEYSWETYKWCKGTKTSLTKYCWDGEYGFNGFVDNKTELELSDDAAFIISEGRFRTPSAEEFLELFEECWWEWVSDYNGTGVKGYRVTNIKDGYIGESIFLPSTAVNGCGYYLSVSGGLPASTTGYFTLHFEPNGGPMINGIYNGIWAGRASVSSKADGNPIRPVCD